MRRLIAVGAVVLLVLAMAVPLASAGSTPLMRHVDGTVVVAEPGDRTWFAKFEVRTTPEGVVQFGYLELYGIGGGPAGEIHQFTIDAVEYYKTDSGARGARLHMQECRIVPSQPCFYSPYEVSDGASVGEDDTFMGQIGWVVQSGNISIYSTPGQSQQ
jgi:hypothetical protein